MSVAQIRDLRNALDGLRSEHLRRSASEARDDLIERTYVLGDTAVAINLSQFAAVAALRRAEMQLGLKRWQDALASLAVARQHIDSLSRHEHGVFLLRMEALAYAGLERWQDVRRVCGEGIAIVEPGRHNVSPLTLQNSYLRFRVELYELAVRAEAEAGDWDVALNISELVKCRSLSRQVAVPLDAGDETALVADYRKVCDQIDQVVAAGGDPAKLLARRRSLWHLLQIARRKSPRGAEAGAASNADVQRGAKDARSNVQHGAAAESLSIADVQRALAGDDVVVNYFWLDTARLLIMAIRDDDHICTMVEIDAGTRAELERIAVALQSDRPPNSAAELPAALAQLLLPLEIRGVLDGRTRLLISPHRVLHALPLHALPWADGYLIESFAVTYIPNLSVLQRQRGASAGDGVLAIGVTHSTVPPADAFPQLAAAAAEVHALETLYGADRCRAFVDDDAREHALMALNENGALARFGVLHFACHGLNIDSDNPMESKLFLRDTALDGLDLATWHTGARLVVLSACCSGQRPVSGRGMSELPGDDLFGLQAAFFAAGAGQIVSTMWPVDSDAAHAITLDFHTRLKAGADTDIALQGAVVGYLHAARARKSLKQQRPYTWAPFFLAAAART